MTTTPTQPRELLDPAGAETGRRARVETWLVRVIAAVAAAAGALAGGEPTGTAASDLFFAGLLAGAVALAAARAARGTWIVLAAAVAVVAPDGWFQVLGAVVLATAIGEVVLDRDDPVAGALIGGVSIQVLLRLDDLGFHGASALLAAVAVLPVIVSGYLAMGAQERRWASRAGVVSGALLTLVLVMFGVTALIGRSDMKTGVDLGEQGLEALRAGEASEAAVLMEESSRSFADAHTWLTSPLVAPARLVPVLGHHASATAAVADAGVEVADAAAVAAENADYEALGVAGGSVDLLALASMEEPASIAASALESAEARVSGLVNPWLVPPVAGPIEDFAAELAETAPKARLAADGLAVAPGLLGADELRRYLLIFGTPAEARGLGGFFGSYGVLEANDGRLELVEHGRIQELVGRLGKVGRTLSGPDDFLARYGRYYPAVFPQNSTASPDLPTVASVMAELFPQLGGDELDGALYVDPYALAALLEITGPVELEGLDEPLDAENAADFLLRDQYVRFSDNEERKDFLGSTSEAVFDAFTERSLPGPGQMGDILAPMVEQGRFLLTSFDSDEDAFLADLGVNGAFPRPDGNDFLSVRSANAGANKLDAYVERAITYDAEYDPATGAVQSTATVTLTNTAPPSGLPDHASGNAASRAGEESAPPEGTAITWLSLYTPLMAGDDALLDGEPLALEVIPELGWNVYSAMIEVLPGQTRTISVPLEGTIDSGPSYRILVDHQPLTRQDDVQLQVTAKGRTKAGMVEQGGPAAGTTDLSVTFGGP